MDGYGIQIRKCPKDVDRRFSEFDAAALAEVFEAHYVCLGEQFER